MSIRAWLESAGLGDFAPRFAALTEPEFKALLMAEYGKFGITDLGAKQRLYQLIKQLNNSDSLGAAHAHQHHYPHRHPAQQQQEYHQHHMLGGDGLLDLDEHDSDLLVPVSGLLVADLPREKVADRMARAPQTGAPAFQVSPMNEHRYQAQQHDGIPPVTEEPPKIKVVVRKRPMNKKVMGRAGGTIDRGQRALPAHRG
jgi:hypothetical protein